METDTNSGTTSAMPLTPLRAVVELVKRGHRDMLPRLRELLRQQPAVWQQVGNLGQQAQRAWVELVGGRDDLLKESVALFAEELKESLVGRNAARLEKLAAERIAAHWLETEYLRLWLAEHPDADGKVGSLYRKRYEEAGRCYERALKSLAEIKKLLPKTIEVTVVNKATRVPTAEHFNGMPAPNNIPGADGGHANMDGSGKKSLNGCTPAPSFTGVNRFNGGRVAAVSSA